MLDLDVKNQINPKMISIPVVYGLEELKHFSLEQIIIFKDVKTLFHLLMQSHIFI
jgi:hypothetical protein